MPPGRITLQHLKPDTSNDPIQQRDARITGTGISLPPNVLLDFMYGVAAYWRWGGGGDEVRHAVQFDGTPIPSEGWNSTVYLSVVDWAHGRSDTCGLTHYLSIPAHL